MINETVEETIKNKVIGRCSSLLIPTKLLESVVDLLIDYSHVDSRNDEIAHGTEEVLEIIAKIEGNLMQVKNYIERKSELSQNISCQSDTAPFLIPPPPFVKDRNTFLNASIRNLDDVVEEDASLSTVSSGSKDGADTNLFKRERETQNDENLTRSMHLSGPLHDRRKSRRMSLPFISPEEVQVDLKAYRKGSTDSLFNRIRRRSSSSSIHPVRMSMLQTPNKLSSRVTDASQNWKQVAIDAFKIIDENGDGYLQKEEVIAAIDMMKENGLGFDAEKTTAELAEVMMKEVDRDGNGVIDIDEFVEMMRSNVSLNGGATNLISYNQRMSQLARNVLLAHQKKMENSVIGKDLWMIHPFSNSHIIWDIMVSLLILLTVVTMPLSLGWEEFNEAFFAVNLTIDLIFLLDVVKNFCTGIIDENEAVIMDKIIVRRNYLSGFFISDFSSSVPLDLIFKIVGLDDMSSAGGAVSSTKNSLKMLKLLRLAKLFRLLRISRLFQHVKDLFLWVEESLNIRVSDGFTKLLRLGIGALVLGHWIGCFNFMLVRMNDFPEDSWVVYAGLDDKGPYTQWSWSFFKALAQMIMIGFETPPFTNASCDTASHWCGIEHWITLMCLYIGAVFYSLLISSISSILQTANLASRHFEEKLVQIDDYMRNKRLPATMREKVKDCFHLQHSNGKLYDENEILDMLTPILRREIKLFNGRDLTLKVPLMSSVDNKNFAEELTTIIEPMISFQNEVIIRENTTGDEMFFINYGVIEIFLAGAQNSVYVAIGDGCYFGEVSLLLGIRRTASARTKTQCMLYKITRKSLLSILQDFPSTFTSMKGVAESRRRRLQHYMNPRKHKLLPQDEVDIEDSKTELFGADAEKVVSAKDEESSRVRSKMRQSHRVAGMKRGAILTGRHTKAQKNMRS